MADSTPPTNPPRKGTWQDIAQEQIEKARARRARVLGHPDIAARLCEPPYKISDPRMWTGYVPDAKRGEDQPNNSPIRRQLIAVLRAVAEREAERGDA